MLAFYSCWSLHSCFCLIHAYHICHAPRYVPAFPLLLGSTSFMLKFTPFILAILIFILALIFISCSHTIHLVDSINALAHLVKVNSCSSLYSCLLLIHAYMHLMFAACSCLSYPQSLYTLSSNSYFLSVSAH